MNPWRQDPWRQWLEGALDDLAERDLLRELHALAVDDAVHVRLDGRELTLFSSNDYLGLSGHPEVREAAAKAARQSGMGPRGSPLVCGYTTSHAALEAELARLKEAEAALLFPTGFAANMAVVSALAGPDVAIFSDALNHASIIDGCRLARRMGATLTVYAHRDTDDLARKLAASEAPRKLIVTDTVFSMDGDLAPLDRLAELKEAHEALLVVDEAHGTLVFGEHGGGVAERFGVAGRVDVHVGTLSKAAGALGGFAATSAELRRWIFNRGRAFVFSTAQPLPVVEAARAAIRIGSGDARLRRRLWDRIALFGQLIGRELASPIVPVICGEESRALAASEALLERGFHVTAIRPPTVAPGTARLRVALSAAHTPQDVTRLAEALGELGLG